MCPGLRVAIHVTLLVWFQPILGDLMAWLDICLLGAFEVTVDGEPVTDLESDTVRALLAYLAHDPGRHHHRSHVAELLWPERPEGAALGNLRHALWVLRTRLGTDPRGTPLVRGNRTRITLAATRGVMVDLVEFERASQSQLSPSDPHAVLRRAASLYRGDFLEDLRLPAAPDWEHWRLVTAERARRRLARLLDRLVALEAELDHADHLDESASRLLEIDPWNLTARCRLILPAEIDARHARHDPGPGTLIVHTDGSSTDWAGSILDVTTCESRSFDTVEELSRWLVNRLRLDAAARRGSRIRGALTSR